MKILEFDSIEEFNRHFKNNNEKYFIKDVKIGFNGGELKKIYVVMQ
jgi:hypothetical protein